MSLKTVQVRLPETVWGQLASLADEEGTTISGLVGAAVWKMLYQPAAERPKPVKTPPQDRLEVLLAEVNEARAAGWRAPKSRRATDARKEKAA